MNITKRLHHRSPYLFINKVIEHSDSLLHAQYIAREDEFYFLGILPENFSDVRLKKILQEMDCAQNNNLVF